MDQLKICKMISDSIGQKKFIDGGGPSSWIKRLSKMGSRGYSTDLATTMEQVWGVRHLIVHRAGLPDRAFSQRHPMVPRAENGRISIEGELLTQYALAIVVFVGMTDRYLTRPCRQ
jgi:hypothetical protein